MSERKCNKCGGSGTLFHPELTAPSSPCWQCGGTGYLPVITTACMGCIDKDKRIAELEAFVAAAHYYHKAFEPLCPKCREANQPSKPR